MKKFSKLNESVKISNDKVELSLSKLDGVEYKIFDYFYITKNDKIGNRSTSYLSDDIEKILPGTKNAKVILINPNIDYSNMELQKWNENFKFQSSGFHFINDTKAVNAQFNQIFNLIEELKEYSPKLCIKDEKFIMYLIGDEVTNSDLDVQKNIKVAYESLYKKLNERDDIFEEVVLQNDLKLSLVPVNSDKMMIVLASLCTHLSKESGFNWMIDHNKDEELEDIRDVIREMGFSINYKAPYYQDDPYTLKLVEI